MQLSVYMGVTNEINVCKIGQALVGMLTLLQGLVYRIYAGFGGFNVRASIIETRVFEYVVILILRQTSMFKKCEFL